jgi:hypothetical protein
MTATQTIAAEPAHVRAAPPHPNPYYGRLAREQPVFRDKVNGWWVVASAAAVNEVLTSELCLTRPPTGRWRKSLATLCVFGMTRRGTG